MQMYLRRTSVFGCGRLYWRKHLILAQVFLNTNNTEIINQRQCVARTVTGSNQSNIYQSFTEIIFTY